MKGLAALAFAVALGHVTGGGSVAIAAESGAAPESGWWWRYQVIGSPATVPPPDHGSDGRLVVETDPLGPNAVAALRADVGALDQPIVRLRIDPDASGDPNALGVVACQATTKWSGGPAQRWDERPSATCDNQVVGAVEHGGTVMSFAVADLVADAQLDIVLQPDTAPDAGSHRMVFARPTSGDLVDANASAGEDDTVTPAPWTNDATASVPAEAAASGTPQEPPSQGDPASAAAIGPVSAGTPNLATGQTSDGSRQLAATAGRGFRSASAELFVGLGLVGIGAAVAYRSLRADLAEWPAERRARRGNPR